MKPAHRTCVTCHKEFLFSNKSYRRSCVSSLIGGERIADILFAKYSFLIADRTSYICISCRGYLVNLLRYEKKVMQRIGMKAAEDTRTVLQVSSGRYSDIFTRKQICCNLISLTGLNKKLSMIKSIGIKQVIK